MGSFWYGLQDLGLGLQRLHHDWSGNGLGEALGETRVTLRQLNRRCGPLTDSTTAQIQALLDFQGPADLAAWLAANS